jgi:serine/threonine protein kinase
LGFINLSSDLPLDVRQKIDKLCVRFERSWQDGKSTPSLEEYIAPVAVEYREVLLRELLVIEKNYRRDAAQVRLADDQLCALHPKLMPQMAEELKALRQEQTKKDVAETATEVLLKSPKFVEATVDHTPKAELSSGSRGLHIRCPHCSNPVELLADTPLESITCRTCGSAFSLTDHGDVTREAPTLKRIGRFELVARLGLGGFGTVWKARDIELDRTVAVKIPRKGQLAREEIQQFLKEARAVAQLRHPNIVPVHEIGREEDTIFIVSDYIRGISMSDWLSGPTPEPHEVARIMSVVAAAVQHAHDHGVIHRDLKPSNILLDDHGQPWVMDFGLAKRETGEIAVTMDGQILGTPAYMSPEQAGGDNQWVDRRSDIYSLGVMMFRMVTGELPFRGNSQMQIHQRLNDDPPHPRQLNRYLPRDLCTICVKCLERDPNRRIQTAKELAEELQRFLRKEPILSQPITRTERVVRWTRRNPAITAASMLMIFLAIAGPIAAFTISKQRNRLSGLVQEKDHVIQNNASEKEKDAAKIDSLNERIAVLEGRANPWAIWKPKPTEAPRKMLMESVSKRQSEFAASWQSAGAEQQAHGQIALAIMDDELDRPDGALTHYQAACDLLVKLSTEKPSEVRYQTALADCYRQIARLRMDSDKDGAKKTLESARGIIQKLAEEGHDVRDQAGWAEVELESTLALGVQGLGNLKQSRKTSEDFAGQVPTDPSGFYELACFLSSREPILSTRKGALEKDVPK